jgi:hypothetical protein
MTKDRPSKLPFFIATALAFLVGYLMWNGPLDWFMHIFRG